jgi:hypothetical protein
MCDRLRVVYRGKTGPAFHYTGVKNEYTTTPVDSIQSFCMRYINAGREFNLYHINGGVTHWLIDSNGDLNTDVRPNEYNGDDLAVFRIQDHRRLVCVREKDTGCCFSEYIETTQEVSMGAKDDHYEISTTVLAFDFRWLDAQIIVDSSLK